MLKSYQITELKLTLKHALARWYAASKNVLLAGGLGFFAAIIWPTPIGVFTDQLLIRQLYAFRGKLSPPKDVVLVAIDDESFGQLKASPRWPFPRKHLAAAVERLVDAAPKIIILDLTAVLEENDPASDSRLVAAMQRGKVTIGQGWTSASEEDKVQEFVMEVDPKFGAAAKAVVPMYIALENGKVWLLGLVGKQSQDPHAALPPQEKYPLYEPLRSVAGIDLSVPPHNALINFYGPPGTMPRIPLYKVLDPQFDGAQVRDKVVLLGFQSLARMRGQFYQESFPAVVSTSVMYGSEIHATIAANLIERSWLKRMSLENTMFLIFLCTLVIVLFALIISVNTAWLLALGILALWCGASYALFTRYAYFLPGALYMAVTIVAILGPVSLVNALRYRLELKLIKKSMGLDED